MLIILFIPGCSSLLKYAVRGTVNNTLGVVETFPILKHIIGGSSTLVINTFDYLESDVTVALTAGVVEGLSADIIYAGKTWEEIREHLDNPHKVAFYLSTIRYKNDITNHPQRPEETVRRGGGDCEDFAILVYDALSYHGYETKLLIVCFEGNDPCHCVGIYKEKRSDNWHFVDRSDVSLGCDNMYDLAREAGKFMGTFDSYIVVDDPEGYFF